MLHSSLSRVGFIVNGPLDVIDSVFDIIGESGTLAVPTHTGQLTDPIDWKNPAIPFEQVAKVRNSIRPFDPNLTIPRNRGIIPQVFLLYPDVIRSTHPLNSIAAKGKNAKILTARHPLHRSEGPDSPAGVLYDIGGVILLIGVGLEACTGLHLAEYIVDVPYLSNTSIKVLIDDVDGRRFEKLNRYPNTSEHFNKIMPDLFSVGALHEISIGNTIATLIDFRTAVDIAVSKLRNDPYYLISD
jgi:aminoglycoside 3-N-acetyltransferase